MLNLFKAVVGSQTYGTFTPNSDIDYKGVYHATLDDILGLTYKQQIDYTKDHVDYEVRRFLELLCSANPTVLELLYTPQDCIKNKHPLFDIILNKKHLFLTKKCRDSFGGYAVAQIRKAKGLNKKLSWEKDKIEKKDPWDFVYITMYDYYIGQTMPLRHLHFLSQIGPHTSYYWTWGLVKLDHMVNCFAIYLPEKGEKFNGIFESETMPRIITSSIPKGRKPFGILHFNYDDYSRHKKDWDSYQTWLKERNVSRYVDSEKHGQKIDSKNLLHCRRLLDMALEIPEKGIVVRRHNADELLKIRRGEVNLDDIIKQAEDDILRLDNIYKGCSLPDNPPDINPILLEIRYTFLKDFKNT